MEYLFKGKQEDTGEWVEGNLITNYSGSYIIVNSATGGYGLTFNLFGEGYPVIPKTVGIYTGFTDGKGVKIFLNDIVVDPCGNKAIVVYENGLVFADYPGCEPMELGSWCTVVGNKCD